MTLVVFFELSLLALKIELLKHVKIYKSKPYFFLVRDYFPHDFLKMVKVSFSYLPTLS